MLPHKLFLQLSVVKIHINFALLLKQVYLIMFTIYQPRLFVCVLKVYFIAARAMSLHLC